MGEEIYFRQGRQRRLLRGGISAENGIRNKTGADGLMQRIQLGQRPTAG